MITPEGLPPRLCYHIQFSDLVTDFKPVGEKDYKIVTFTDLIAEIIDYQQQSQKPLI